MRQIRFFFTCVTIATNAHYSALNSPSAGGLIRMTLPIGEQDLHL